MTEWSRDERNVCHFSQARTLIVAKGGQFLQRYCAATRSRGLFRTWHDCQRRAVVCLPAYLPSHSWMHFHVITGSPRRPCHAYSYGLVWSKDAYPSSLPLYFCISSLCSLVSSYLLILFFNSSFASFLIISSYYI